MTNYTFRDIGDANGTYVSGGDTIFLEATDVTYQVDANAGTIPFNVGDSRIHALSGGGGGGGGGVTSAQLNAVINQNNAKNAEQDQKLNSLQQNAHAPLKVTFNAGSATFDGATQTLNIPPAGADVKLQSASYDAAPKTAKLKLSDNSEIPLDLSALGDGDTKATSASLDPSTSKLTISMSDGSTVEADLSPLKTEGTKLTTFDFDADARTLSIKTSDGNTHTVDVTSLAEDKKLQSAIYDDTAKNLKLTLSDGTNFNVDLTALAEGNARVTAADFNPASNKLKLTLSDGNFIEADMAPLAVKPQKIELDGNTFKLTLTDSTVLEQSLADLMGVSADADNALVAGSDGKAYLVKLEAADATLAATKDGAGGTATTWARSDHQHKAQPVSADADNSLTVGSDGFHYFKEGDEVIEKVGPLTGTAPAGAQWGVDVSTGQAYFVKNSQWTPMPVLTVDISMTVSDQSAQNTGSAPVSPPGDPDTGDIHLETYKDGMVWWTWDGSNWAASAQVDVAPNAATATPLAPTKDGAVGTSVTFARADHQHPPTPVSADQEQLLKSGSDGFPMLDPDDMLSADSDNKLVKGTDAKLYVAPATAVMATQISPAASDATGLLGTSAKAAREDHKHPAQGVSTDTNQVLKLGADGLHLLDPADIVSADDPNLLRVGSDKKLKVAPSPWHDLPMGRGWKAYGGAFYPTQYRVFGDLLYIRGLAQGVDSSAQTKLIATLPQGFRPAKACVFTAWVGFKNKDHRSRAVRVGVNTSGKIEIVNTDRNIHPFNPGQVAWVSLDGIHIWRSV